MEKLNKSSNLNKAIGPGKYNPKLINVRPINYACWLAYLCSSYSDVTLMPHNGKWR